MRSFLYCTDTFFYSVPKSLKRDIVQRSFRDSDPERTRLGDGSVEGYQIQFTSA